MSDLEKQFARIGAQHRLNELQGEQIRILKIFPDLKPTASTVFTTTSTTPTRRRRSMSAAARKAVSARMKKYWAAKRRDEK